MIVAKLAKREIRNNLRYWIFFSINLVVGLLGFTFIFLFRENVFESLNARSTQLLTSDIAITGRRALSDLEREKVDRFMHGKYKVSSELTELYSMAKGIESGKTRLVFIKFIQGTYPLRGQIKLQDAGLVNEAMIEKLNSSPGVWISSEVAHQFKLEKDSELKVGKQIFKVMDVIESDTTSSMRGFSLAPKIYIGRSQLEATDLMGFGTVAWRSLFYNLPKETDREELKKDLEQIITDPAIKVKTPKNSSEQFGRVIGYLSDFLGLIGVVALLMSAVGISYLYQSYIYDRLKQIGILKTLGLPRGQILWSFVLIILAMGLFSSVITLGLAQVLLPIGISYLKEFFTGDFQLGLNLPVVLSVISLSFLINLLTCGPILWSLFGEKTIHLLNQEPKNKIRLSHYIPAALFMWGLSVWQARSFIIGSVFFFSLLVVFIIVMTVLPILLNKISRSLIGKLVSQPGSLTYGYSLRLLSRNKLTTLLTILCLSIGTTLISVIGQLDKSLKAELTSSKEPKPSLFMFDIQEEQVDDLIAFTRNNEIPMRRPTPMVRARLVKKNGEEVKRQKREEGFRTREEEQSRRFNNRGVNLSYAEGLNKSETMEKGGPFSGAYSGEGMAEVSLEKRYAKRLKVDVGDTLTYDILGVEVQAKIVNLRKVTWTSFLPNFFILFQPGVLEDAPKTFLSVVDAVPFERQLEIQDQMVENFSNISILNVTEIVQKILVLFKAMAWAIGLMSLCCIVVGLFVLYSILQSQLFKKQKELALQKLIGMGEQSVLKIVLVEYGLICLFSQFLGSAIGAAVAYLVSFIFLDGVYIFNWEFFLGFNIVLYILANLTIVFTFKTNYQKNIKELLLD